MKNALAKMLDSCKGAMNLTTILVEVALAVALIPVIKTFIASSSGNFSATELVLMGLIGLFLVIALVFSIMKSSGLTSKK